MRGEPIGRTSSSPTSRVYSTWPFYRNGLYYCNGIAINHCPLIKAEHQKMMKEHDRMGVEHKKMLTEHPAK